MTLSKMIDAILSNQNDLDEKLAIHLEGVEAAIIGLSEKIDAMPDKFKDDIHRSLLTLREDLEAAKPIKPNNWDSVREAFKGPMRIEINERN